MSGGRTLYKWTNSARTIKKITGAHGKLKQAFKFLKSTLQITSNRNIIARLGPFIQCLQVCVNK